MISILEILKSRDHSKLVKTSHFSSSVIQAPCLSGQGQAGPASLNPNVPEDFKFMEKAPTRAFSWLNAPTSAFTFNLTLILRGS